MSIEGLLRIQLEPSMTNSFIDWIDVIAVLVVVMRFLPAKHNRINLFCLSCQVIPYNSYNVKNICTV